MTRFLSENDPHLFAKARSREIKFPLGTWQWIKGLPFKITSSVLLSSNIKLQPGCLLKACYEPFRITGERENLFHKLQSELKNAFGGCWVNWLDGSLLDWITLRSSLIAMFETRHNRIFQQVLSMNDFCAIQTRKFSDFLNFLLYYNVYIESTSSGESTENFEEEIK